MRRSLVTLLPLLFALPACDGAGPGSDDDAFLDGETSAGKFDTGYQTSLDAREVEVDIEGDVSAPSYDLQRAPLDVGQFALTYLRKNNDVFIQSLAEDYAHGTDQIEWLASGAWTTWAKVPSTSRSKLTHFRMRGVSTVILHPGDASKLKGKVYNPIVPKRPTTLWSDVAAGCGEQDGSIEPSQDVYWYVWTPEKASCRSTLKQTVKVTVATVLPKGPVTYPEYDRLTADKKIDVLVLFGQVDHGTLSSGDYAFSLIKSFESSLRSAKFTKVTAPLGLRYQRTRLGIVETIDIYSPREFSGLDDYAHFDNFDKGINSHEIIVYNGHSMLGASDFWARKSIYQDPAKYQIFLYNGCLGYEYYVDPILEGKQSWDNVDIVSNIVETPFSIMVRESATTISMVMYGAEHGGTTTWQSIMTRQNEIAATGDSFYGASGVRTNLFMPHK
jgi:hypothetical protein